MKPLVFLHEEQIRILFENKTLTTTNGFAYCMDDASVIHAFSEIPKVLPSGKGIRTLFLIYESKDKLEQSQIDDYHDNSLIISLYELTF